MPSPRSRGNKRGNIESLGQGDRDAYPDDRRDQREQQNEDALPRRKQELPVAGRHGHSSGASEQNLEDPAEQKQPEREQDFGRDLIIENIRQCPQIRVKPYFDL